MTLEPREGAVALWVGPSTEGYFANLKITGTTSRDRGRRQKPGLLGWNTEGPE